MYFIHCIYCTNEILSISLQHQINDSQTNKNDIMKNFSTKRTLKDNFFLQAAKEYLQSINEYADYCYSTLIRIGRKSVK